MGYDLTTEAISLIYFSNITPKQWCNLELYYLSHPECAGKNPEHSILVDTMCKCGLLRIDPSLKDGSEKYTVTSNGNQMRYDLMKTKE